MKKIIKILIVLILLMIYLSATDECSSSYVSLYFTDDVKVKRIDKLEIPKVVFWYTVLNYTEYYFLLSGPDGYLYKYSCDK